MISAMGGIFIALILADGWKLFIHAPFLCYIAAMI